jgi:hypothetical protein
MAKKTTKDAKGFDGIFETTSTPKTNDQVVKQEPKTPSTPETKTGKRKSPKGPQEPNEQGFVRYTFMCDADDLETIKYMAKLTGRSNSKTLNDAIKFYLSKKWTDGHKTAAAQLKKLIS